MAFFASLKATASKAAQSAQELAQKTADEARRTVESLKSEPTELVCATCSSHIPVPQDAFNWRCVCGHSNASKTTACEACNAAKPQALPNPIVTCTQCHTAQEVPASKFRQQMKEASEKTKIFAKEAVTTVKATATHLSSTPQTFHCAHCDSLLGVPQGEWSCQTCTTINQEADKQCSKCTQRKSEQKAICGVCMQSTKIPTSVFENSLRHTVRDVTESTKKVYYDLSNKPYITCNRCSAHVPLNANRVSPPVAASSPSHASDASGVAQPAPVPGRIHLECPSCKQIVEA